MGFIRLQGAKAADNGGCEPPQPTLFWTMRSPVSGDLLLSLAALSIPAKSPFSVMFSRPGGLGLADLYVTTRESTDDPWQPPESRTHRQHSVLRGQPSISANGKTLYWDAYRPDGLGDADIWMATREALGETFGPAVNVGPPVNTDPTSDRQSATTNDNCSSRRAGRATSVRSTSGWSNAGRTRRGRVRGDSHQRRYPEFALLPSDADTSGQRKEVCFMAFRPEGFGGLDIWCAERLQWSQPASGRDRTHGVQQRRGRLLVNCCWYSAHSDTRSTLSVSPSRSRARGNRVPFDTRVAEAQIIAGGLDLAPFRRRVPYVWK
jgi:hypothetical protein